MGTNVKSVHVNFSVILAEMLLCSYFSETYALLVLLVLKVAFISGALMLDGCSRNSQESLSTCSGQGTAIGYTAKKQSTQTNNARKIEDT